MTLRDYQNEAVVFLFPRQRGCVVAPAGSGKTIIGAYAAAFAVCRIYAAVQRPVRMFWLCNTLEQCQQGTAAIQKAECSAPAEIEVCCYAARPDLSQADIVIVDECHHVPAETLRDALVNAPAGAVIWGLTATPAHEDPFRNAVVEAAFREFFFIARERVEASGHLIKGKVYLHDFDVPNEFNAAIDAAVLVEVKRRIRAFPRIAPFEHQRRVQWQVTQEYVQANPARNAAICAFANRFSATGESVLVLVYSIEHGEQLAQNISGAACVHSKLPKKRRAALIAGLRDGSLKVLIATSLADEGLDVPRASRLILAAGGRSAGKLEQRAGRVLRPFAGKNGGEIHDFLDRGATFAHAQAKARMKVYEALGYEPEIIRPGDVKSS